MNLRLLPFCAAGIFLTGCAASPGSSPSAAADQGSVVRGYLYHDANHPDGFSELYPHSVYKADHGTWLWPPAVSDKPN